MLLGYILIIILVSFDQIIKLLSLLFKNETSSLIKVIIPEVLEFHHIINKGASFGMLENRQSLFAVITIVALLMFGLLFSHINFKNKKVYSISIILFISGTFGNAIDRLFRSGGVIDMLNMPVLNNILSIFNISPFIFNIADVYLNFAIILFIIDMLFLEKRRSDLSNEN